MSQDRVQSSTIKELNDCEHKLLNVPGSIQPHGILIALKEPELKIIKVSDNTKEFLGIPAETLLEKELDRLLKIDRIEAIEDFLQEKIDSINYFKIEITNSNKQKYFDAIVQRTKTGIILELEPRATLEEASFSRFHNLVKGTIGKIKKIINPREFLQSIAKEVQKITEFDRVTIYKFDRSGAGEVVAEAKRSPLLSYLGLHYPATDIPTPAKELYKRNSIRFIPNINARAVKLIPKEDITNSEPLDLSLSVLRSVDPCCIEYHQNMGVAALLVVPIIKEQKLWGLISAHHQTPKYLPYQIRTEIEFLGKIVSLELVHKQARSELEYGIKLKSVQSEFVKSIAKADNFKDALINFPTYLLDLVGAEGAAVCLGNEINLFGVTPTTEAVNKIIDRADSWIEESIFSTDSLIKFYPEAEAIKDTVSGLLILRLSQIRRYYILWFRPEVITRVTWAGNPYERKNEENDNLRLSPRKSFEKWLEIVKFTAIPWQECEIENALNLRNALVSIVIKKTEELAELVEELKTRNQELDFFAYAASHDLKEPLRGICNYLTFMLEDYGEVLDRTGRQRLETSIRLGERMETLIDTLFNFSRLGKVTLKRELTDLNQLIDRVIEVFRASKRGTDFEIRILKPLPQIECDPVLVEEVFTNLLANAFKYYDKPQKWVEIGHYLEEPGRYVFYVRDNGIGIRDRHLETIFRLFKRLHPQKKYGGGTGAGLTIAKKIVERHGGKIWVESDYGRASTFYFTLQSRKF
ncbi:MAG: ATP-binding protein [Prochloraceae cyanobacterium]